MVPMVMISVTKPGVLDGSDDVVSLYTVRTYMVMVAIIRSTLPDVIVLMATLFCTSSVVTNVMVFVVVWVLLAIGSEVGKAEEQYISAR